MSDRDREGVDQEAVDARAADQEGGGTRRAAAGPTAAGSGPTAAGPTAADPPARRGSDSVRLTDAWRLGPSEVIALVGGGGKTSLMEALARDYEDEGGRVVLTTTTKIRPPVAGGRRLLLADTLEGLLARLRPESGRSSASSPVVGRRLLTGEKVEGIPPGWVAALRDAPGIDAVLVEADGSAGRSLKAPAAWEPVIPECATLVVAVAGLDAQGVPLDDRHVHRPELVAEILDLPVGSPVPPEGVLETLVRGFLPRVPRGAAFRVFLNKLDAVSPAPSLEDACARSPVEVWTGAVGSRPAGGPAMLRTLNEGERRPAAIVLAAGLARRMGGVKLLAPLGDGTVLGWVMSAVSSCRDRLSQVVIVSGAGGEDVGALGGVSRVAVNPDPAAGQASSLRVGVEAVGGGVDILVLLGDQPFVTAQTLGRLLDAREASPRAAGVGLAGVVAGAGPAGADVSPVGRSSRSTSGGLVGPPVVLHRSLVPQVLELEGDRGARDLLERYGDRVIAVQGGAREVLDVDTPEALAYARSLVGTREGGASALPT